MKKAQASAEYMLVSALILLIILPTIYIFYSYSNKSSDEIRQSQVNKVGTDIVDAAEQVYYLGEPSKTTIDAIMPEGVEKIEIWHNQELVFFLNDGTEIPLKSRVNITTNSLCTEQTERCHYNFKKTITSQGLKHIIIEAKGDYVILREEDLTEVCNGIDDDYDGLVDEDFTNENCQPKCEYNGYTWTGNSGSLNCCGNDANEDSPYQLNEKVPADYCADGNDNDCDGLIDALDPDCFACTPSEIRLCSEQTGVCAGSFETCTAEGTWPGCSASNYGPDYESPETSCSDGLDNDCDGNTDAADSDCFDCTPGSTRLCSEQDGVCSGSFETCTAEGTWPGCSASDYGPDYENPETICYDNKDNDCDGLTDCNDIINCEGAICTADGANICIDGVYGSECAYADGFACTPSETRLCSEQTGVCAGSFETCTAGGTWPGCSSPNYGSDYESPETSCSGGLDNDCDGNTDCADSDCLSDPACLVCVCSSGDECCSNGCNYDADGTRCWIGSWATYCDYSSICDENALCTQSRNYKTCSSGSCSITLSESQSCGTCTRNTDGISCGADAYYVYESNSNCAPWCTRCKVRYQIDKECSNENCVYVGSWYLYGVWGTDCYPYCRYPSCCDFWTVNNCCVTSAPICD